MKSRQLKHSLILYFLLIAVVPMFLLSLIVLFHLTHDTKKEARRNNQLITKTIESQVEIFLHQPRSVLQNIRIMLQVNPTWSSDTIQQILNLHTRESDSLESVYLLDAEGTVTGTGLPVDRQELQNDLVGINLAHLPFYQQAIRTGTPTWSDTFFSVLTGRMSVALCMPVDKGALIGNLDITKLADFITRLSSDRHIQAALIDRSGAIIVHTEPNLSATQLNVRNLPIIQEGFAGREKTERFTFEGISYLGSVKKISGPEWLILVSQSISDAYHPVSSTALYFIIVATVAIIGTILLALLKTRRIIRPITEIVSQARQIADGNYAVTLSSSPYPEIQELAGSMKDLADAVQNRESELQMSRKRFKEIYNATGEAIFIRDPQTLRLIDANRSMTQLFGYSLEELKNISIEDLSAGIPDQVLQKTRGLVDSVMADGPQILERKYKRRGGKIFWAEVTLKEADIDGRKRILGVIRDITERKSLEQQLMQAQKMEAIGTLAGGIAHDFNNILTPILGYVEMAMLNLKNTDRLKRDLEEVIRSILRAKELVQQILSFSRQEGHHITPIDVSIIVKEVLKLLRSSIPTTIQIKQSIAPDCGLVLANPIQIHQIIMNLCTNAYHSMRESGGILDVSLTLVTIDPHIGHPRITLPPGNYLRLEVADTGHGISPDVRARIMEPYFTTKGREEGTGLGLSVVHGIVKSLGGEIHVESEVGQGSSFQIFLPVVETCGTQTARKQTLMPAGGSERILLVDDEKLILNLEREILAGLGYEVTTFSNPEDALASFKEQPDAYDLIISDMTMPNMTGDVLIATVREFRTDIPAILCTGFSEVINREQALARGINEFITKPFQQYDLGSIVRRVLDAASPSSS